jgi:hypothetical protein
MQTEILRFAAAVIAYWGTLLTGGVIIAAVALWEHYHGSAIPWSWVQAGAFLAFVVATFQAWRDQYRALIAETAYRSRAADEFAQLRHAAQKRFYLWWEGSFDGTKREQAKADAEDMRRQIVEKLRDEISEAEADYFNTPRMFEPFPSERNLIHSPEAVLINEFGYRIQRLSDIIQRILPDRGTRRVIP